MSNLWLNLRLLWWHLQIGRDRPWIALRLNRYLWQRGIGWRWIELHEFRLPHR